MYFGLESFSHSFFSARPASNDLVFFDHAIAESVFLTASVYDRYYYPDWGHPAEQQDCEIQQSHEMTCL